MNQPSNPNSSSQDRSSCHEEEEEERLEKAIRNTLFLKTYKNKLLMRRIKFSKILCTDLALHTHFISIRKYQNLPVISDPHEWKDRLIHLLYKANIPKFWILKVIPGIVKTDRIPNMVMIKFISFHLKNIAHQKLKCFISQNHPTVAIFG